MIIDDILVPLPTAPEKYVSDIETIDDLIDSLLANASAQDFLPPEEPRSEHEPKRHYRPSLTHRGYDTNLRFYTKRNERPVPGYADFPKHIAQNLNFEDPYAQQIPQTSPPHGRRRAQPKLRQKNPRATKSRPGIQPSRRQKRDPQKQKTQQITPRGRLKSTDLKPSNLSSWATQFWQATL